MTLSNYTRNILNTKDININFYENCLENKIINGIETKIFRGYLTYIPTHCPLCKKKNYGFDDIIKCNWKRNCKVILPKVSNYNAILLLDKQRFLCKHCGKHFIAESSLIDKWCFISNNTNLSIKLDLMNKISEKDIATKHNVSHNHINRIIDNLSKKLSYQVLYLQLLILVNLKLLRDTKGKMAFHIINNRTGKTFDIL